MTRKNEARYAIAVHLAAVWFTGCFLTSLQFHLVLPALLSGWKATVVVSAVAVLLGVALLAAFGSAVRRFVPFIRRRRGPWLWAAGVYAFGTTAAFVALMASQRGHGLELAPWFFPFAGACHALAAAAFLPGARTRLTTLAAAAVLATGWTYVVWDANRTPTLDEWITANGVDRTMLRVGDAPPGYTLRRTGASEHGSGAAYERPGSAELHLRVERVGHDTRRTDARGCPVPFGETIRCADDGGGRLLVVYENGHGDGRERRELRLSRDGLVHTVTLGNSPADLTAARHVLSTLRPATDSELAGLVELPMRR